jgi:putative oxidoreductase
MSSVAVDTPRSFVPFLARLYAPFAPYAYTLIRFALGAIFVPHGYVKLFVTGVGGLTKILAGWGLPAPLAWAYGVAGLEFFGGILLALGLLTRPIALLFVIEMIVAAVGVHSKVWAWNQGGAQYPVFLAVFSFLVFVRGGGRHSLDNRVFAGVAWLRERFPAATYALMRVAIALFILPSGYNKVFEGGVYRIAKGNVPKAGFSPPELWAWLVGGLEFFGVILFAIGLLTRPVAFMLAFEMAVIAFRVHNDAGFFWTAHGYEYALLMMGIFVAFMIGGGGRYSLDRRLGREF